MLTSEFLASAVFLGTVQAQAVHPENGAVDVATNARVFVEYYSDSTSDETDLALDIDVLVGGTSLSGSVSHVGRYATAGLGLVVHGYRLAVFVPDAPLPDSSTLSVTLSTAFGWTGGTSYFQTGTLADEAPPTGGVILEASTFDNRDADDDDPGDQAIFGYEATLSPASDGEGSAFLLIEGTSPELLGQPLVSPFVVAGSTFVNAGLNTQEGDVLRVAAQAIDMAGNSGVLHEMLIPLPRNRTKAPGCTCSVSRSGMRWSVMAVFLFGLALALQRRAQT